MTSIDPRLRLAAALSHEVAALRGRTATPGTQVGPAAQGAAGPSGPRRPVTTLSGALAQRIAAISPEDPERKQKAFRVFLETALLQELGAALIHDASFPLMVEAVQFRMQGDAQLAKAAEELAAYLLEKPPRGQGP